ncbi:toxin-antitoxin system YwqK family antitoxin [Fusobacterium polymorphum]|uniref:hypothetical protein n=1 Tax=Fusobacterium nucleatum subsp. polymorphum TaxID=76857 RepID=UPI001EF0A01A|nr:hypothetical protein [Fusobacterium nucleatum]MCG6838103.1 hypothetical protein [Fusobacterium nucleatum]
METHSLDKENNDILISTEKRNYINNKLEGEATVYLGDTTEILVKKNYKNNLLNGNYEEFCQNKKILEATYKDGKLDGEVKVFSKVDEDNGKMVLLQTYKDNKRNGKYIFNNYYVSYDYREIPLEYCNPIFSKIIDEKNINVTTLEYDYEYDIDFLKIER